MTDETKSLAVAEPEQKKRVDKKDLKSMLEASRDAIAGIIPKHMDPEQVLRTAWLVCYKEPKLRTADPVTVVQGVLQAASLGLIIGRTAHLVPFWNKEKKLYDAVFVPDYRGLVDLAHRGGGILDMEVRVAYRGEHFDVQYGDAPSIKHTPRFDGTVERGWENILAIYTVTLLPNPGGNPLRKFEVMPFAELDAVRKKFSRPGTPWTGSDSDKTEMGKKTVVKRACKMLPQSPELAAALEYDNRGDTGEVGAVLPLDTEGSLAMQVAVASEEKMDSLRSAVEEQNKKVKKWKVPKEVTVAELGDPALTPPDPRRTEVVDVEESKAPPEPAPDANKSPWPDWPEEQ